MLREPEPRAKKWIEVNQKLEENMAYDNGRYECRNIVCPIHR